MASAYLSRTLGTPTNEKKWTYSAWIKRAQFPSGHGQFLISCFTDSNNRGRVYIEDGNLQLEVGDRVSGAFDLQKKTNAMLRDQSAWYHIVVGHDRTISTPVTNMYINGVLQTSFAQDNVVSQNAATSWNKSGSTMLIGKYGGGAQYFSGYMSHVHFIDGTIYAASAFGESDSNGVWIPKPSPSVTYGNNGCFLKFDNSGNMGLDSGGGSNNFTTSGTITQAKDTPSNVFATCNPLHKDGGSAITFTNGNTTADVGSGNDWCTTPSTLGATSGKFYFEAKLTLNSNNEAYIGVANQGNLTVKTNVANYLGIDADSIGWYSGNGNSYYNASASSYGNSWTTGDIVGCAIDIDNSKLYFSKNGTWQNSGDPTSGSTGTGALNLYHTAGDVWHLCVSPNQSKLECNFGNGYFGTTAVTSAGTNASDNGVFEYDVPTGYTALSTKGLNS